MKTKIYLFGSLLAVGLLTTSCAEDFLDQENTTSPNAETFFNSDEAIDPMCGTALTTKAITAWATEGPTT